MWIIFGWSKEQSQVGEFGTFYCFDCRRSTPWILVNTSEWVTLSALRVLRFVNRHDAHCGRCTFASRLAGADVAVIRRAVRAAQTIDATPLHEELAARFEAEQFASKTPQQIRFIRESMAAEREYRDRLKAQTSRLDD